MKAVRPSFESCAAPCWLKGFTALATCGTLRIAVAAWLIAFWLVPPSSSLPVRGGEDDRALAVLLRREPRRQEVGRLLAVRPREPQVVRRVVTDDADHDGDRRDRATHTASTSSRWSAIHRPIL